MSKTVVTKDQTGAAVETYLFDKLAGDSVGHLVLESVMDFRKTACKKVLEMPDTLPATGEFKKCPYCVSGEIAPRKIPATKKETAPAPVLPEPEFATLRGKVQAAYDAFNDAQGKRTGGRNVKDDVALYETLASLSANLKTHLPASRKGHSGTPGTQSVSVAGKCPGSGQAPKPGTVSVGKEGKGSWRSGVCPECSRRRTMRRGKNDGTMVDHPPVVKAS